MTGLIPAVAQRYGIPALITIHNIHTERVTLAQIEDRGIDAADFWQHLYFQRPPGSYEETREHNPTDLLTSGIFAADHVNSVSPTFLDEVIHGRHDFIPDHIRHELWAKCNAGCATGILNAPDVSFDPATDRHLDVHFTAEDHPEGKRANKAALQEEIGLDVNPEAPLFYWPSRLDPVQKGCQLLTDILFQLVADYAADQLQVAVIASGAYQQHFHDIVAMHGIRNRIAVLDFDERLSRKAYASADFIFMPSSFEPCGLPQMVSPKYGTLTIAHDTGGLHDTVEPLDIDANTGNGFLFQHFDTIGLRWACDEAMRFYRQPAELRSRTLSRIMTESAERFNHASTAAEYIKLYERMLQRPITSQ
jgi:ADP-glucose type glycogen/starch synthase